MAKYAVRPHRHTDDGDGGRVAVEELETDGADGTVPTAQADGSLSMQAASGGGASEVLAEGGPITIASGGNAGEIDTGIGDINRYVKPVVTFADNAAVNSDTPIVEGSHQASVGVFDPVEYVVYWNGTTNTWHIAIYNNTFGLGDMDFNWKLIGY